MSSQAKSHEPCPRCRKAGKDRTGDNLAVYDDGHRFCFGCGYYESGRVIDRVMGLRNKKDPVDKFIYIPADLGDSIHPRGRAWLDKYGITSQEISNYGFKWSPSREWLVMPSFPTGDTIPYQARCFDKNADERKTFTGGAVDLIVNIYGVKSDSVVIVEDPISAIKVARQTQAMPLYGSHISSNKMLKVGNFVDEIVVWLDYDKTDVAFKILNTIRSFGIRGRLIITTKDPKDYDDNEISDILDTGSSYDIRPPIELSAEHEYECYC